MNFTGTELHASTINTFCQLTQHKSKNIIFSSKIAQLVSINNAKNILYINLIEGVNIFYPDSVNPNWL